MIIAAVLPCYRVKDQILRVLEAIPPEVSRIYVVDDACPEKSGAHVSTHSHDPRVTVLTHIANQGVGGAMVTGFRKALEDGAQIIVKIDGDGQMDPALLPHFIRPIREGTADFTKGNRFFDLRSLQGMPAIRLFGNTVLSFLTKIATGYWGMMDPTNGYLAIHAGALSLIPLEKLSRGYFFETDLLFRLNTVRAVIRDIPMKARYADEKSSLRIGRILLQFPPKYIACFFKRVFYSYILRDFNLASVQLLCGLPLILFGVAFGISHWIASAQTGAFSSSGTVMLASLPIILGFQLLLSAMNYDLLNLPKDPIQRNGIR